MADRVNVSPAEVAEAAGRLTRLVWTGDAKGFADEFARWTMKVAYAGIVSD